MIFKEDESEKLDAYKIKKVYTYFWYGNYVEAKTPLIESNFVFLEIEKNEQKSGGKKTKKKLAH